MMNIMIVARKRSLDTNLNASQTYAVVLERALWGIDVERSQDPELPDGFPVHRSAL